MFGVSGSASVRLPPAGLSNFTACRPGTFGDGAAAGLVAPWLFHGVDFHPARPPVIDHTAPVALPRWPPCAPALPPDAGGAVVAPVGRVVEADPDEAGAGVVDAGVVDAGEVVPGEVGVVAPGAVVVVLVPASEPDVAVGGVPGEELVLGADVDGVDVDEVGVAVDEDPPPAPVSPPPVVGVAGWAMVAWVGAGAADGEDVAFDSGAAGNGQPCGAVDGELIDAGVVDPAPPDVTVVGGVPELDAGVPELEPVVVSPAVVLEADAVVAVEVTVLGAVEVGAVLDGEAAVVVLGVSVVLGVVVGGVLVAVGLPAVGAGVPAAAGALGPS